MTPAETITLVVTPARDADGSRAHRRQHPLFEAHLYDGTFVVRSHQPLLDGARALIAKGHDPSGWITMRHKGKDYDSFKPVKISEAAKLTVEERDRSSIRFGLWQSMDTSSLKGRS